MWGKRLKMDYYLWELIFAGRGTLGEGQDQGRVWIAGVPLSPKKEAGGGRSGWNREEPPYSPPGQPPPVCCASADLQHLPLAGCLRAGCGHLPSGTPSPLGSSVGPRGSPHPAHSPSDSRGSCHTDEFPLSTRSTGSEPSAQGHADFVEIPRRLLMHWVPTGNQALRTVPLRARRKQNWGGSPGLPTPSALT